MRTDIRTISTEATPKTSRTRHAYLAGRFGGMRAFASLMSRLDGEAAPTRSTGLLDKLAETTALARLPVRAP